MWSFLWAIGISGAFVVAPMVTWVALGESQRLRWWHWLVALGVWTVLVVGCWQWPLLMWVLLGTLIAYENASARAFWPPAPAGMD